MLRKYVPVKVTALTRKRGRPDGPVKWNRRRLTRFLTLYADAVIRERLPSAEALRIVALIENIGFKGAELRLTQARQVVRSIDLPEWARDDRVLKQGRRFPRSRYRKGF